MGERMTRAKALNAEMENLFAPVSKACQQRPKTTAPKCSLSNWHNFTMALKFNPYEFCRIQWRSLALGESQWPSFGSLAVAALPLWKPVVVTGCQWNDRIRYKTS